MGDWIARTLAGGSTKLDPDSPLVRFEFAHPLEGWHWALVIAGSVLLGWWSYSRLEGSRWVRIATGVVRAAVLVLLVVLLCGPRMVEVKENVERDWVLVLVDRSASMGIVDAPGDGATLRTREAQLRAVLARGAPVFEKMGAERTVKWLGFDAGAYDLPLSGGSQPLLEDPSGRRTDLAAAVEAALAKGAARPIAGIVVLSDGRTAGGAGLPRTLLKRLASEKIPVVVVPLGSAEGLTDIAVGSAEAPPAAFVNDPVPVRVTVTRTGVRVPGPSKVTLVNRDGGDTLDETTIEWAEGETSKLVTLTGRAATGGERADWEVRVEPQSGDARDLIDGNNKADVGFSLVDRPLRLLYVDGYPRWEYRFLKNIFARDESVKFSSLLLSAGRKYLQEGSEEIDSLPDSAEGWDAFDVIMIGDVQPGVLSAQQLEQLRNRVAVGGAGLLWVAGPSAVPGAYRGTPLADLLPVVVGGSVGETVAVWDRDVVLRQAPLAEGLGVLRLADRQADGGFWPPQVSDVSAGWSRLRWMQRLEPGMLKPAAEALALAAPVDGVGTPTPAVVTMRFGAGRVVYIATDEVWRYRYGRGEDLPERFYMQIIRLLGRESVARAGKSAVLTLTPREAEVGVAVRVGVELIDQALLDARPTGLTVRMTRSATGAGDAEQADVLLKPTGDTGGGRARAYVGTWVPPSAGAWTGVVTDALLEGKGVSAAVDVAIPDDELRRPEADHGLLTSLAQETGGTVLGEGTIDRLPSVLPKREVRTMSIARQETLWDRPGVLAVLIGLLVTEWVLRRVIRLI